MTRLLLAGATGLVGGNALALLLADERVTQIIAPTRRPLPPHPRLLNPIADASNLPSDAGWAIDGAICALGTTRAKARSAAAYRAVDYEYALAIAALARKAGATRLALVTSMGADPASRFRYTRTKGELEEAVRGLGFPSLTIVRPGFLGGGRDDARPMERIVGGILTRMDPILPASARISPASIVAAFLVEAAIGGSAGTHVISAANIAIATGDRR
jgi:uncharacterized protein YbjT (DUF2867 family)